MVRCSRFRSARSGSQVLPFSISVYKVLFKRDIGPADASGVRLLAKLTLGCAAVSSALWVAPTAAVGAAHTDLATVVVSQTLPGFLETAPGPTNGPITPSNASLLTGNSEFTSQLQQELANGTLTGYLRIWTHPPMDGDSIVVLAFRLPDSDQAQEFLTGLNRGVSSVAAGNFDVPSIGGASGFISRQPLQGQPANEYSVTFGRGTTVFEVETATITQGLTTNDATLVASSQAGQAGGSVVPPSSPSGATLQIPLLRVPYVLGEIGAVLAIVTLVLYFMRRERRQSRAALLGPADQSVSPGWVGSPLAPPASVLAGLPQLQGFGVPSVQTPAPGWYQDTMDPSRLRYFDGAVWTAHTSLR
jgi:Protein of unknown function (DUF2510)